MAPSGAAEVRVTADPRIFPAFEGRESLEITAWLEDRLKHAPSTVKYFEQNLALYAVLVRRNKKNAELLQRWLPYELLFRIVAHPQMKSRPELLPICTTVCISPLSRPYPARISPAPRPVPHPS